jgi:hypothetical protein
MLGVVIEIGRSRVVERTCVGDRFYTLNHQKLYVVHVNLRPGRTLRKSRESSVGKGGESDVES